MATESDMTQPLSSEIDPKAKEFFDTFNSRITQLYDVEKELGEILGGIGHEVKVVPPFVCTNGSNTFLGDGVHINLETFFEDRGEIRLGNKVLTGPFLKVITLREDGTVAPVTIEDDVWIGGGVTIHPGIRIGKGAVISAGSNITEDVAENALVVGAPAKQFKEVDQTEVPEGIEPNPQEPEKQKMVSGRIFYSSDPQLKIDKQKAYEFFRNFNLQSAQLTPEERMQRLKSIFSTVGKNINVGRLYFSYGYQIFIGSKVEIGDRVFLGDAGKITIGDGAVLGQEVQLYTTNHCLPIPYRSYITAEDITIGPKAQIGKRAIILPGITIGEGAIVAQNSVVTHDVPANTKVSGIPAKVV